MGTELQKEENTSLIRYKVLFLASWYPSRVHPISGIFVKRHSEAVAKYCDVTVLFITSDPHLKDKTYELIFSEEDNVPVIRLYYRKPVKIPIIGKLISLYRYLRSAYLGLKFIKEKFGKPDIVHVNIAMPMGIIGFLLNIFRGIPYIITEHSTIYFPADGRYKGVSKILTYFIVRFSEAITVVSTALKKAMLDKGLKNRYFIVPNVVDVRIVPAISQKNNFNSKRRIFHISLMKDKQKNISGILSVLNKIILERKRNNFELHILGDGEDRKKLEDMAKELDLYGKYVFFHGKKTQQEIYEYLQNANFLIINSNYETFSVVTAEAIACGVPVIATRCGGPEDFVTEDVGILIEPGNQKQLEEAILYMLDNCDKYDKRKLQEYAKERFSYEIVGRKFYEIYKSILIKWNVGLSGHKVYIHPDWKVIDIGSGHNPNRRANVLLEKNLEESVHRSGEKANVPKDKIMVVGDATNMHFFKDKEFDYAIASHVAEHIDDIEKFLKEVQRIAKRGYIETPGPVSEFFLNEPYHLWIVKNKRGTLIFERKQKFRPFSKFFYSIFYLNEYRFGHETLKSKNKVIIMIKFILNRVWKFIPYTYTKYEWEGEIKFKLER